MPREFIKELSGDRRREAIDIYDRQGLKGKMMNENDN